MTFKEIRNNWRAIWEARAARKSKKQTVHERLLRVIGRSGVLRFDRRQRWEK